ncbi:MAG: flagellar hook-associated protein FlgK [Denitrovibrio sp.]|nr:MAG: flagellar hook-associated protein FlgK [Denitrovibrio sp.]
MSNLMHIFSTGVSGLYASQAGIDVTGHNIANVNTEGYSRQRVTLETMDPSVRGNVIFGRGVNVDSVERIYDDLMASTIRDETSDLQYYESMQLSLSKVEVYFNELEDGSGLGESMQEYFDAWSDLANTAPDQSDEALIKRETLIEKASMLSEKIQSSYNALQSIKEESNTVIIEYVDEINQISDNIAYLNKNIAQSEAGGEIANDFRDQRQVLLNRLAEITNITVNERTSGQVAVYVSGNALVDEGVVFNISAEKASVDNPNVEIYWGTKDQDRDRVNITTAFKSGSIAGEMYNRDDLIEGYKDTLNSLATTLIEETNRIHSVGQGTNRLTQISSSNGVTNPTYTFNEPAGALPLTVNAGTLRISIYNESGTKVNDLDIEIDPDIDNMNSIITKISSADGNPNGGMIQASISVNNSIKITAGSGYDFTFSEDTSNFLVASGTYGFFSGSDASNIGVSTIIQDNSSFIAASASGAPGDNENAAKISNLKGQNLINEQDITIDEFYSFFVASIGSDKSKADTYVSTKEQAISQLSLKLEEIRGVSMDEEMTNLMKFQRAFEASSRFITTIDEMLATLVNGLGA